MERILIYMFILYINILNIFYKLNWPQVLRLEQKKNIYKIYFISLIFMFF